MRLEWGRLFQEDVGAMEAFHHKKEGEKAALKAAKKEDWEERRAKAAARKEMEEKAARKAKEKKNGTDPSTVIVDSSSSFGWTSTPGSLDVDWDPSSLG